MAKHNNLNHPLYPSYFTSSPGELPIRCPPNYHVTRRQLYNHRCTGASFPLPGPGLYSLHFGADSDQFRSLATIARWDVLHGWTTTIYQAAQRRVLEKRHATRTP